MLPLHEYERMRTRPTGSHVMVQSWRSLLFVHWACDPNLIQPLLPAGLELDTFDGQAWVGLVPFRMQGVRARGMPWSLNFPETNVRTYVHRKGADPGVWFFSLDADSRLACNVARATWNLPYHFSDMTLAESANCCEYSCVRKTGLASMVSGEALRSPSETTPGTLEFFLIERYLLYAQRAGRLLTGRVFHPPYPVASASVLTLEDQLVESNGISGFEPNHVLFSPGVDVQVFRIHA